MIMRRRFYSGAKDEGKLAKDAVAGDVVLYNKIKKKIVIVDVDLINAVDYPTEKYTPIAFVIIPGNHDVYGDGSCAAVSLVHMSTTTPEAGEISYQRTVMLGWSSQIDAPTGLQNYPRIPFIGGGGMFFENIQGESQYSYLPADSLTSIACPNEIAGVFYHADSNTYAPSPYGKGEIRNPLYYQTTSPASVNNALSDFNGKQNTQILANLSTYQPNWRTDSTITSQSVQNHFPAALCCQRFKTEGTNPGDWYLPSCGELGYFCVRNYKILRNINKIEKVFGECCTKYFNDREYWSSTWNGNWNGARSIHLKYGEVAYCNPGAANSVRAYIRIK